MAAATDTVVWSTPEGVVERTRVELAAGVTVYKGARVMLYTAGASQGYYGPADAAETGLIVGESVDPYGTADNSAGADGDVSVLIRWFVPKRLVPMKNDQGGTPLTRANRGSIVNALDDTTVTGAVSTCVAGRFFGLHRPQGGGLRVPGGGVFDDWDANGLAWIEVL